MIRKSHLKTGVAIAISLLLWACATGKKQFDIGMELQKAEKYEESVAYLEQALKLQPQSKPYLKALADVKAEWIQQLVAQGSEALKASPLTMMDINKAAANLAQARLVEADSPIVKNFAGELKAARQALLSDVKKSYDQAKQYVNDEKWLQAYFNLQQIQNRFPGYEDTLTLLNQIATEGANAYYEQARGLFEQNDFKGAIDFLRKALSIKADHRLARDLLELAEQRDNKTYFLDQAQISVTKQQWDQAMLMLTKAQSYDPADPELQDHIHRIQASAGDFFIQSAWRELNGGMLKKAMENYKQAKKYAVDPLSGEIDKLQTELCSMASYISESFKEQGKLGSAWFWYKQIGTINPEYPQIFYLTQEVLLFKVDASTSEGAKTVRYQIGERIEDNIDYLNWKAKHPDPDAEEVAQAPEAKIKVPVIVEKEYIVAHHKKIAFVQISFRIVDVITGENIQVKTIERKQLAEDEASAGLAEAGVKFDSMEIPTDTELLQNLAEEVVAELGREVLKPIQNLQKTYFQQGEQNLRRRDNLEAAERFVNAIFNEKMKRIEDSPLTASAMKHLDDIFRDYSVKSDSTGEVKD